MPVWRSSRRQVPVRLIAAVGAVPFHGSDPRKAFSSAFFRRRCIRFPCNPWRCDGCTWWCRASPRLRPASSPTLRPTASIRRLVAQPTAVFLGHVGRSYRPHRLHISLLVRHRCRIVASGAPTTSRLVSKRFRNVVPRIDIIGASHRYLSRKVSIGSDRPLQRATNPAASQSTFGSLRSKVRVEPGFVASGLGNVDVRLHIRRRGCRARLDAHLVTSFGRRRVVRGRGTRATRRAWTKEAEAERIDRRGTRGRKVDLANSWKRT